MPNRFRKFIATSCAAALMTVPVAAQANTRAGDSSTYYTLASVNQPANLQPGSTSAEEDDDSRALIFWLAGGAAVLLLLSAVISNEPDRRITPPRSNGAN